MSTIPNDRDEAAAWLEQNGYTGLFCPEEPCGCDIGDLVPCGEDFSLCVPAYAALCDGSVCSYCESGATDENPVPCIVSAAMLDSEEASDE